jgi:rubrerythrin
MTEDLRDKLASLAQLDCDATEVYDEAIKHIQSEDVKSAFVHFRDQHEHHLEELSAAIVRLTGQAIDVRQDMMGHVSEWVVRARSMSGEHGALEAMRMAEKYHVDRYREAASWQTDDQPLDDMLKRFYEEEIHHLGLIEKKLGVREHVTTR